jgi:hypothetical protein
VVAGLGVQRADDFLNIAAGAARHEILPFATTSVIRTSFSLK